MSDTNTKIVEINGVKLEVDLRHAKTIDTYKVGDNVKVLVKQYSSSWAVYPGVIISFDEFRNLPTIVVAYLENSWSSCDIKIVNINSDSKDTEICLAHIEDLAITKESVLESLNRTIGKAEVALRETQQKKEYILKHFDAWFKKLEGAEV